MSAVAAPASVFKDRAFNAEKLALIEELVARRRGLSRQELAYTVGSCSSSTQRTVLELLQVPTSAYGQ